MAAAVKNMTTPRAHAPARVKAATAPKVKGGKVTLLIGAGLALGLANTEAQPLVVAVLLAGVVYQTIQIFGGKANA